MDTVYLLQMINPSLPHALRHRRRRALNAEARCPTDQHTRNGVVDHQVLGVIGFSRKKWCNRDFPLFLKGEAPRNPSFSSFSHHLHPFSLQNGHTLGARTQSGKGNLDGFCPRLECTHPSHSRLYSHHIPHEMAVSWGMLRCFRSYLGSVAKAQTYEIKRGFICRKPIHSHDTFLARLVTNVLQPGSEHHHPFLGFSTNFPKIFPLLDQLLQLTTGYGKWHQPRRSKSPWLWIAPSGPWEWSANIRRPHCDRALEIMFFYREIIPKWPNYSG